MWKIYLKDVENLLKGCGKKENLFMIFRFMISFFSARKLHHSSIKF